MNTMSHHMIKAYYQEECIYPALGEMLPDYVVELLEDTAAAGVEDHLLDCLHCRETYLKMLTLEAPRRRPAATPDSGTPPEPKAMPDADGSNVISMADFKRRRS